VYLSPYIVQQLSLQDAGRIKKFYIHPDVKLGLSYKEEGRPLDASGVSWRNKYVTELPVDALTEDELTGLLEQ